ncbi:hypothetical protein GCK72_022600 [Caenorhabditis remanei]|uniref:Uncharacterized protein n=1 Tax=Caenorhabditis remanei TaxID=31234 RepID=A0A6A5FU83_CAERE|nr:hypothetical protein GCK72_022600 [Caenorhabditis remanei]KAF1746147.1 hypothetical protein GCK72_022600 [Caenorhabditis remanei]
MSDASTSSSSMLTYCDGCKSWEECESDCLERKIPVPDPDTSICEYMDCIATKEGFVYAKAPRPCKSCHEYAQGFVRKICELADDGLFKQRLVLAEIRQKRKEFEINEQEQANNRALIEELKQQIEQQKKEIDDLKRAHDKEKKTVTMLYENLDKVEEDKLKWVEKLHFAKNEISSQKSECSALEHTMTVKDAEISRLVNQLQELSKKCVFLESRIDRQSQDTVTGLEIIRDHLQNDLALQKEKLENMLEKSRSEQEEMLRLTEELKNQKQKYEQKLESRSDHKEKLRQLAADLETQKNRSDDLYQELNDFKTSYDEIWEENKALKKEQLKQLSEDDESRKEQTEKIRQLSMELENQKNVYETKLDDLAKNFKKTKSLSDDLTQQLNNFKTSYEEKCEENKVLKKEQTKLKKMNEQLSEEASQTFITVQDLSHQLEEQQQKIEVLRGDMTEKKEELDQLRGARENSLEDRFTILPYHRRKSMPVSFGIEGGAPMVGGGPSGFGGQPRSGGASRGGSLSRGGGPMRIGAPTGFGGQVGVGGPHHIAPPVRPSGNPGPHQFQNKRFFKKRGHKKSFPY